MMMVEVVLVAAREVYYNKYFSERNMKILLHSKQTHINHRHHRHHHHHLRRVNVHVIWLLLYKND